MNPNTFGYMGSSSTYKTGLSHLVQRPLSNYQSHQNAGTVLITHFLLPFTLPFRTNLFILHKCCSGCHNFLKTVALLCPLSKIALYNMLQYLHNLKCIELKDNSEPHSSIESSCKKGQSLELQSGAHEWQTDQRFINKAIQGYPLCLKKLDLLPTDLLYSSSNNSNSSQQGGTNHSLQLYTDILLNFVNHVCIF